jgi:hypothetical protein
MLQQKEISRLQRIASLENLHKKSFAIMPSFVVSILPIRSKSFSKRRPKRRSSQTRGIRAQLLVLLRRKKLIRMR